MGEAKNRGTLEERQQQAEERHQEEIGAAINGAEVVVCLREVEGGINLTIIPRDEAPNSESLAVIVASWLNSNLVAITRAAVLAKERSERPAAQVATQEGPVLVTGRPVRSITTPEGALARDAGLLGPDGRPLQ